MLSFNLYLLFTISYFLHLTSRIPALGLARFDLILMVLIILSTLGQSNNSEQAIENSKIGSSLKILLLYILITIPFVQWPGSVVKNGIENYSKVIFFFFASVSIVNTEKRLKYLIVFFVFCQLFRILEPVYLHLTAGYWGDKASSFVSGEESWLKRLAGAPHDVVNSNQLAWVINMTIPLLYYLLWRSTKPLKLIFLGVTPILIYALMLTGSRSGLLSLFMLIITILLLNEKKRISKLLKGAIIIIPVSLIIAGLLSDDLKTRYRSLYDDKAIGADTAQGRVKGLQKGLSTIANRPLFGHGLGTSRETNVNILGSKAQISHNLYIETLQEVGVVGFALFMFFVKEIISSLRQAKRNLEASQSDNIWLKNLISALQVWIVMDLFYSLSCFGLNSWEWYFFGGIATVCLRLSGQYVDKETDIRVEANIGLAKGMLEAR